MGNIDISKEIENTSVDDIEIVDQGVRYLKTGSPGNIRYAWKVTIKNNGTRTIKPILNFQLLDKDGFAIHQATRQLILLPAGKTITESDQNFMSKNLWDQVEKTKVYIEE